jgi:UDP-N-acetylmuramoyl-L-alanyl-D-glutamate--2,6-diaminopimelate ligase
VFTNITHDHLDYHGTFANYLKAKQTFFTGLPATAFALSNLDDRNGEVMLQNTSARRHYYALHRAAAQYRLRILEHQLRGMLVEYRQHELWLQLTGQFNAYNVLAVLAVADLLGEDLDATLVAASLLTPAPGRLDIQAYAGGYYAAVDYAHTPDALLNVLNTVNEIRPENGRLITVVGCGGDRDTAKRPEMGRIAADLSDHVILTSDNPRTEDPLRILADIRAGITASRLAAVETLPDRQAAIERAVELARPGDLVVVAGKGHETYQEIAGHRYPFDDRQVLHEAFARKTGGSFGASATAASTDPETRT